MTGINAIRLPIDWAAFGWAPAVNLDGIALSTGEPAWSWEPSAPAFTVPTFVGPEAPDVIDFAVDHVVLLVPDLEEAIATFHLVGVSPRLRMLVRDRPAAFFRARTVVEVIESPVRSASIYGIALSTTRSLESVALEWKALGVSVGDIRKAIQPNRRIFTVRDTDAGLAVLSADTSR